MKITTSRILDEHNSNNNNVNASPAFEQQVVDRAFNKYTTLYEHGAAMLFNRAKKLRQINNNTIRTNSGDHVAAVKITKINNNISDEKNGRNKFTNGNPLNKFKLAINVLI